MGYSYVFNPLAGAFDTVQDFQTVTAPDNAYIPPTGPVVFSDAFTEASTKLLNLHTPNVGTSWTLAQNTGGATYSVYNNGRVGPTTTLVNVGCLYLANNIAPSDAVEVAITAPVISSGANVVGFVFRYVDSNNFYLYTISGSSANCVLYKKVAGVWTNLGGSNIGLTTGGTARVRAVGTNIIVTFNDVITKITTDSSITAAGLCGLSAGTIGQNTTDDVSNAWQLDNFTVTNYASSGGTNKNGINVVGDIVTAQNQVVAHGNTTSIYPAFTFNGDTDTGMYRTTTDSIGFATAGALRLTVNAGGISVGGGVYTGNGTVSAPSHTFSADTNTGFYSQAADTIGITTAGTLKWSINSTGVLLRNGAGIPSGAVDITTSGAVSNSGGSAGGFLAYNTIDYINTYFQSQDYSGGAGLYGEGKLYFTSGTDYSIASTPGVEFYIAATSFDTSIGDFNVNIGTVTGTNGGNINLYAGASASSGDGGVIGIYGGASTDQVGGSITISGGYGPTSYGLVIIQPTATAPIAVFGSGGSAQIDTTVTGATFTAGTGTAVNNNSTFDGYTIGQVVAALRNYGWLV